MAGVFMQGRMGGMAEDHPSKLLARAANATLGYPFLAVGSLYACWLLAGRTLGHAPVAWIDDPAQALGAYCAGWLYPSISILAIVAIIPVFIASVVCNVTYVLRRRPSAVQAGIRAFTVAGVWLWYWIWVTKDPHEILKWWMD